MITIKLRNGEISFSNMLHAVFYCAELNAKASWWKRTFNPYKLITTK